MADIHKMRAGLESCMQPVCPKDCPYNRTDGICEINDDLLSYIKRIADSIPSWVSVKDKMPEGVVLAANFAKGTYNYKDVIIGRVFPPRLSEPGGCFAENDHEMIHDVTHWMCIPDSPEEE